MDEINFIKDPIQTSGLNQCHELQKSIILQDSESSIHFETYNSLKNHRQLPDEAALSYKGSSKSNINGSDDIDLEQIEEYKQAEIEALSSFVEKRNLEISIINDKYDHQVKMLE